MHLHRYDEYAMLPLRIFISAIFLFTGITKAIHLSQTAQMFADLHIPIPLAFAFLVMIVEIVGGACILFGLFTRHASIALTIVILVAIALVNWRWVMNPEMRVNFFLILVLLGGLVTLIFSGAKRPSLDEHFLLD